MAYKYSFYRVNPELGYYLKYKFNSKKATAVNVKDTTIKKIDLPREENLTGIMEEDFNEVLKQVRKRLYI